MASSYGSSISRSSSRSDIGHGGGGDSVHSAIDEEYRIGNIVVDPINVKHDADDSQMDGRHSSTDADAEMDATASIVRASTGAALNSVRSYDFVVDVSTPSLYLSLSAVCVLHF